MLFKIFIAFTTVPRAFFKVKNVFGHKQAEKTLDYYGPSGTNEKHFSSLKKKNVSGTSQHYKHTLLPTYTVFSAFSAHEIQIYLNVAAPLATLRLQ